MGAATKFQNPTSETGKDKPSILVAGGAGFLGSYLCEALTTQGFNVVCVDNLKHGTKTNIERLLQLPNFTFWQEDINKTGFTVTPTILLTHIFHLASVEEFLSTDDVSLQTLTVNSVGTKNLLDLAVAKKAKFVFVSSSEVLHGAITQTNLTKYFSGEQKFDHFTFAEAKRFAEALVTEYVKDRDLSATVVRIKDPYGPRMDLSAKNPMADFIRQAAREKKIGIIGDGLKTLNPTFVTDIVFGLVKASLRGEKGDIFNLINPNKQTERSVAETLKKITGVDIELKTVDEVDTPSLPLTTGKAEEKLNWSPKVSLEQGLSQTLDFYKEHPKDAHDRGSTPKQLVPQLRMMKRPPASRGLILKLFLVSFFAALAWFVILPLVLFGSSLYLADRNLNAAVSGLENASVAGSVNQSQKAVKYYKKGQGSLGSMAWVYPLVGAKKVSAESHDYLFMAENIALSTENTALAIEAILAASQPAIEGGEILEKIELARESLRQARGSLEMASSLGVRSERLPLFLREEFKKKQENSSVLENTIKSLEVSLSKID